MSKAYDSILRGLKEFAEATDNEKLLNQINDLLNEQPDNSNSVNMQIENNNKVNPKI